MKKNNTKSKAAKKTKKAVKKQSISKRDLIVMIAKSFTINKKSLKSLAKKNGIDGEKLYKCLMDGALEGDVVMVGIPHFLDINFIDMENEGVFKVVKVTEHDIAFDQRAMLMD